MTHVPCVDAHDFAAIVFAPTVRRYITTTLLLYDCSPTVFIYYADGQAFRYLHMFLCVTAKLYFVSRYRIVIQTVTSSLSKNKNGFLLYPSLFKEINKSLSKIKICFTCFWRVYWIQYLYNLKTLHFRHEKNFPVLNFYFHANTTSILNDY